jgi:hypothetical protein
MARYQAALWIGILVLGGSLAVAASRVAATGKGLRLWLHSCVNFLLAFMEAVVRVCGRLLLTVIYFVEILALAVAAPIFLLRGRELPSLHTVADTRPQAFTAHTTS